MKKFFHAVRLYAVHILLLTLLISTAGAETAAAPPWGEPQGGQLDDTAYAHLLPGGSGYFSPCSSGSEVLAATIVANARSLVDKYPYVYGGESPEEGGFDCTGLVWYVYNRMSGLNITLSQAGRSKAALAAAGEKIYDHDAFLPGDVIQFTYAHVAIYVGGGRVVHARTTGTYIQETDLNYSNVEYAVRYPGVVQSEILDSGTFGDALEWTLRRNGELTVSGSGSMPDYADDTSVPWYSYRESIVSVILDETVTSIGDFTFYGCRNLANITAPGITKIGHAAFYDCAALTDFSFSGSISSIGMWSFYHCTGLTELSLPDSLTGIDKGAFFGCTGLVSVAVPDSVTSIGDWVFENCSGLQSVILPDSVTHIGESLFFGCEQLKSVTFGNKVETIDAYAFYGCVSLTSISIPKSVSSIGDWAFADCTALETVIYSGTSVLWETVQFGSSNDPLLTAEVICTGIPDTPVVTITADTSGTVTLTWDAVRSAAKYEIWRAAGNTGEFMKLCEQAETEFHDDTAVPGTVYYYTVRAVAGNALGEYSDILVFHQIRRESGKIALPPV